MSEILKKLTIATGTLFAALLITVIITGRKLFETNLKDILICYAVYITIYLSVLLIGKKLNIKKQK
jgi:hypothetical protein